MGTPCASPPPPENQIRHITITLPYLHTEAHGGNNQKLHLFYGILTDVEREYHCGLYMVQWYLGKQMI